VNTRLAAEISVARPYGTCHHAPHQRAVTRAQHAVESGAGQILPMIVGIITIPVIIRPNGLFLGWLLSSGSLSAMADARA